MKAKPVLWLYLLVPFWCQAQDTLPPVFELRDVSSKAISDPYWQMLENKNGKIGFPEIMRTAGFHPSTVKKEGMGFNGVKDYWVRWRMKNLTGKDQELVFASNRGNFKRDYYIIRDSGAVAHLQSGWAVPLSQRDTFRTRNGILVAIPSNKEITIYARVRLSATDFFNE